MQKVLPYFLLITILFLAGHSNAQVTDTKGTAFYFTAPYRNFINFSVLICSDRDVTGTLSTFKPYQKSFSIPKDSCITITLANELVPFSDTLRKNHILISTSDSVTVYSTLFANGADDGSIILPSQSLPTEYYPNYYFERQRVDTFVNAYSIISSQNKNQVQVQYKLSTINIDLNANESYTISNNISEIVKVVSIENPPVPFNLFTGGRQSIGKCNEDSCCYDLLFEQMLPEAFFGKEYISVPFKYGAKEITRIKAIGNNTCISINNGPGVVIQYGQTIDTVLSASAYIRASQKINITQFLRSNACSESDLGDPEYLMVFPSSYFIKRSVFRTPVGFFSKFYVNVIVKTNDINSLELDGQRIDTAFKKIASNPNYSFGQIEIQPGQHILQSEKGFNAFVYGLSGGTSSANSSAFYLTGDTVHTEIITPSPLNISNDTTICNGTYLTLRGTDPNASYTWQDGSTNIDYTTNQPGVYWVQAINTCLNTISKDTIEVKVAACDCTIDMPDIFTPNNDRINDRLLLRNNCLALSNFRWRIYDRHGFLVFETHNPFDYWDGKFKNTEVPDGIYIYELVYDNGISSVTKHGTVAVLK